MSQEELNNHSPVPALDQLSSRSLNNLLTKGGLVYDGLNKVYESAYQCFWPDQVKLQRLLGRFPSARGYIKVAKESEQARRTLRNEFAMLTDPVIRPFAVACSSRRCDTGSSTPNLLLLEAAEGFAFNHKTTRQADLARLSEEDYGRIVYQLALVYQRFHDKNASAADVGKALAYRKPFDVLDPRPFANPARIVIYDLGWTKALPNLGGERSIAIIKDQHEFVQNLAELLGMSPRKKLGFIQEIAEGILNGTPFISFAAIARQIDRSFNGKFSQEYQRITGIAPAVESDKSFSSLEFTNAKALFLQTSAPAIGQDVGVYEGLLSQKGMESLTFSDGITVRVIGSLMEKGSNCTTRGEMANYLSNRLRHMGDLPDALRRLEDGRTLLDAVLDAAEDNGLIVANQARQKKTSVTEKAYEAMKYSIGMGLRTQDKLTSRLIDKWDFDQGDPFASLSNGYSPFSLLLVHFAEEGLVELGV